MRPIALSALLLSPSLLLAQDQCKPPTHLATQEPFQVTHYFSAPGQNNTAVPPIPQALPATYRGFLALCNLTANANLSVSQIDFVLSDDGAIRFNWGPAPGVAGPPGLVGQTAAVNVYATPTSWRNASVTAPPTQATGWTLVATGKLTVAPHTKHSPAVFAKPFTVPVGSNGYAIEVGPVTSPVAVITYIAPPYALHPWLLVSTAAPRAPLTAKDQFLSITDEDMTNQAFVVAPLATTKSAIFDIHYTVAADAAYYTPYSAGCYDRPRSFYEVFPGVPTPFDLSYSAFQMVPTATSYAVSPTTATIVPPTTPPLTNTSSTPAPLGDDERTPSLPLGFVFPYPGGSTSNIVVTSNGNIFLDPANSGTQQSRFEAFGVAGFLKGQPQLAPLWGDLNPSPTTGGGSIHLDVDLTAPVPVAYVTWKGVPEFGVLGSTNTVQVAMFASGKVEYRYGLCSVVNNPALVGWSSGWSAHDPGMRDISASLPFTTGNGAVPPFLSMSARPILGTTPSLLVADMPANAPGSLLLGGPRVAVDLGGVGMPGCLGQITPILALFLQATGTTASIPVKIPNTPALAGVHVTGQGIVVSPASNALGLTVSNPLCISLGR